MVFPRVIAVATLLQLGCSSDRLVASVGALSASPNPLTFAAVAPRATVSAPLQVTNQTRAALVVTLVADAPYQVEPSTLTLQSGQLVTVDVRFSPVNSGAQPGQLTLTSDGTRTSVTLEGIASCVATSSCMSAQFDPVRGCVEVPVTNGTSCSDRCLTGATCEEGACKGETLSCDDGDPCTTDACGPSGCMHPTCLPPADPCQVASCEGTGCVTHDADDGTACGPGDCVTARICLRGACVSAAPPEGMACDNFCGTGRCHDRQCEPATQSLEPRWSYLTAPSTELSSKIALDALGNLYWTENAFSPTHNTELVSLTRDGAPRFRAVIGADGSVSGQPLFVDDATGLVLSARPGGLAGVRTADGAVVWSHAVIGEYFTAAELTPAVSTFLIGLADLGGGRGVAEFLLYPPEVAGTSSPSATALIGFDLATGAKRWGNLRPELSSNLVADEHGNFYLRTYSITASLESRDSAGTLRWLAPLTAPTWSSPLAAFDGRLYLAHGETLDAQTGQQLAGTPIAASEATQFGFTDLQYLEGSWLVSARVAIYEEGPYAKLRAIDPVTHQVKWTDTRGVYEPSGAPIDASALLDDGSVLMIDLSTQWELVHVDPTGQRADVCPILLDRNKVYGPSGLALQQGRLFTSAQQQSSASGVYAFDLPSATLAPHGWGVAHGAVNQGAAPR